MRPSVVAHGRAERIHRDARRPGARPIAAAADWARAGPAAARDSEGRARQRRAAVGHRAAPRPAGAGERDPARRQQPGSRRPLRHGEPRRRRCSTKAPEPARRWSSPTPWSSSAPSSPPAVRSTTARCGCRRRSRTWPRRWPLLADVVLRPTFPAAELDRLKKERLAALVQAQDDPAAMIGYAFPRVVFGPTHRYGTPAGGLAPAIEAHHRRRGPRVLQGALRLRQRHDRRHRRRDAGGRRRRSSTRHSPAGLRAGPRAAPAALPAAPQLTRREIVLVDKPGAAQSQIRIGWVGVPRSTPDYATLEVLNTILGGSFGVAAEPEPARAERLHLRRRLGVRHARFGRAVPCATAGVQTDKTADALREFFVELEGITKPIPAAEIEKAKNYVALGFPGEFETTRNLAQKLEELIVYNLPEDRVSVVRRRRGEGDAADVAEGGGPLHPAGQDGGGDRRRSQGDRARHRGAQPRADSRRADRGVLQIDPIVVVGAGAAGLMAAISAASGPAPVLLLERTADGGRKILISGGRPLQHPALDAGARALRHRFAAAPDARHAARVAAGRSMVRFFEERRRRARSPSRPRRGKLFPRSNRARDVRDGLVELARATRRAAPHSTHASTRFQVRGDGRWQRRPAPSVRRA